LNLRSRIGDKYHPQSARPAAVTQRCLPITPALGKKVAASAGTIFLLGLTVLQGAIFGTIFGVVTIFLINPIYHWITGSWVDSVVYQLATSFWATLVALACLGVFIKEKFVEGESRLIPYLSVALGEFSTALMLVGLFATLVALGGPFVPLAAFLEVFKHGVTVPEAFEMAFFLGSAFSLIEIGTVAYRRRGGRDRREDMAYYFAEAEKYREKAKAASEPSLKVAFETVAREYVTKAHALDPAHPSRS
jgi:hypothetical protein